MKPRIAILADTLPLNNPVIDERRAAFAARQMIDGVTRAGGLPIILPSLAPEEMADYLPEFDGIIFAGGFDVNPLYYGENPHPKLGATFRPRDLAEMAMLKAVIKTDKPLLGICRGMQLINVGLGGSLYQDLSENPAIKIQHSQNASGELPTHYINTVSDSKINELLGDHPFVNSRHHQAIHKVAPNLKVTATADDQTVEALESANGDQILALQFHPENLYQDDATFLNVFKDLVERARKAAN